MLSESEISIIVVKQQIYRLNQAIIAEENRLNSLTVSLNLSKEIYNTAKSIMDENIFKAAELTEKEAAMTSSDKELERASLRVDLENFKADEIAARQNHAKALRKYIGYQAEYDKCDTTLKKLKLKLDEKTKLQSNLSLSWSDSSALDPLSNEALAEKKEACLKAKFLIYKPA